MACALTINTPTGHTLAGKIVDIELTGTASVPDCDAVELTLNCSGFPGKTTAPVDAAGNWKVVFTSADPLVLDNCPCGEEVTVFVQCLKGKVQGVPPQPVPGCTATWSGELICQPACPDINWLAPKSDPKCNPDGTRNVSNLGAVVTNPVLPLIVAQLEWVEGKLVLDGPKQGAGQVSLGPVKHAFPSGTQTLHVTVTSPPACGGSKSPVQVDPCGPIGACCLPVLGVANATVCEEMTKAECDAKGGAYQGDGTMCDQVDCGGPPNKNGGDGGGGGPSTCGSFTFVVAALLALTLGAALLVATLYCLGIPVPPFIWGFVAGLAIATVAVIVLWYALCILGVCVCPTPCDWLNIIWMATLAAAIVALYLSGCCPVELAVSVLLFGLAVLWWAGWVASCKPDACSVLMSFVVAITSGALVAMAYAVLIPAIAICGLSPVPVAAQTLAGILAVALAACKLAKPKPKP
jgi:hypothetical protein